MAHPGTLPVINRDAVRHVLRVGTALGSKLADYTEFDRKSYFYPDIPKGYQISQYEFPLVAGGQLAGVDITRIHLEEDTARSSHGTGESLVDFNRAGVPLMELVTEPVIHDAETAGKFARELQLLLRTLGASDANLEKGEMRIEANISVSKTDTFGTKTEVKNLNSFRSVERAIAYEIERQSKVLDEGGTLIQETRGWDENTQTTFHQRVKEGSADYRYFPEPDLPKMILSEIPEFHVDALRETLPELPWERRARYAALGLKESDVQSLGATIERSVFFDKVLSLLGITAAEISAAEASLVQLATNYLVSDVGGWYAKQDGVELDGFSAEHFVSLIRMIADNKLSSRGAKDVLAVMLAEGGEPEAIATKNGLLQVSDPEALRAIVRDVIAANAVAVEEYKGGKEASLQFLVGQSMKASKGAGNPGLLKELLIAELT
jgi:aspartyl-tRNA(Asn)/glutamyl-tRNA(Gln) amidotransferase subunit B